MKTKNYRGAHPKVVRSIQAFPEGRADLVGLASTLGVVYALGFRKLPLRGHDDESRGICHTFCGQKLGLSCFLWLW